MKVPRKKKSVAVKSALKLIDKADQLAADYEEWSKKAAEAERRKNELKVVIKALALKNGHKVDNEQIIEGSRYKVGFSEIRIAYLDYDVAKKLLSETVLKQCLADPQLDKQKFEQLVDTGIINRKRAAKIVKFQPTQMRVVVKRTRRNPKA